MKAFKAELFLLAVTFIWGGTFIFTKIGLDDCPPSLYLVLRFSLAIFISLIFFGKHLKKVPADIIKQGLLLGVFFGGGFILQTYGLKQTTVSKSAFITGMAVILTPFAYKLVVKKSVGLFPKIGVFIAAIGLFVFTNPSFGIINPGDLITLFSTVFWAFYITYMDVFTKKRTEFAETMQLVIMQFFAAGPIALIFFFLLDFPDYQFNISNTLLISLAYNGIIASFMLTLIHTSVQRYTTPVKAALIFSLEPVIASFIAVIAINETLAFREYIGAGILFSGVLISEIGAFLFRNDSNVN